MAGLPTADLLQINKIDTLERLICYCIYSLKKNINTKDNPQAQTIDYSTLINLSLSRFNQRSGKLNISITFIMDKEKYYADGNIIASLYEYTSYDIFYDNPATFNSVANSNPLNIEAIPYYVNSMEQLLLWALIQWNISLSISYYDGIINKAIHDPDGERKIFIHNDEPNYVETFDSNAGTFTVEATLPFDWLLYMYTFNILDSIYQVAVALTIRVIEPTSVVDALYDPLNKNQDIEIPQHTLQLAAINNPPQYGAYAGVVNTEDSEPNENAYSGEAPFYIKADKPDWYMSWFDGFDV